MNACIGSVIMWLTVSGGLEGESSMTCRERMSNGGVVPKVVAQTTNRIRASRSS